MKFEKVCQKKTNKLVEKEIKAEKDRSNLYEEYRLIIEEEVKDKSKE
jgi:hypothetical protein